MSRIQALRCGFTQAEALILTAYDAEVTASLNASLISFQSVFIFVLMPVRMATAASAMKANSSAYSTRSWPSSSLQSCRSRTVPS